MRVLGGVHISMAMHIASALSSPVLGANFFSCKAECSTEILISRNLELRARCDFFRAGLNAPLQVSSHES